MEKWIKRSVDLLTSLSFGADRNPSVVPYYPQKTEISGVSSPYFRRSTPEKMGISSSRIYNMLCELEWERRANVHNLMIIANGEVICQCAAPGYSTEVYHLAHSMSKTVTGMAIGILCDDGALSVDQTLVSIFPDEKYTDERFAFITVDHLLTMRSGIPFSEAGSVTETDWTGAIFRSSLSFDPGTKFKYNSMNSYMLAKIVEKVSGEPFVDFVANRLFLPLGIDNYFWEKGPEGVEKGGWGLYLTAESWGTLGLMVLEGGVFNERRILSAEWIEAATKPRVTAPSSSGDFNYAYQMWAGRNSDELLFNGMLGQNVWICPKNRIVAVVNSGNNELFQMSPSLEIIRKYLGGNINDGVFGNDFDVLKKKEREFFESRRWARPLMKKRGLLYFLRLRPSAPFDTRWNKVLGDYLLPRNSIGMLPLVVSGMQNNFSTGIERISLSRVGELLMLDFTEGGVDYSLEIGLYGGVNTVLDFRGERYIVCCVGEARRSRFGSVEYRIEMCFPELPNTRMLTISPIDDGEVRIAFSESPDQRIVSSLLSRIPTSGSVASFVYDIIRRNGGENYLENKLVDIFNPEVLAFSKDRNDLESLLKEEGERISERTGAEKLIVMVVERFFRDDSLQSEESEKPQRSIKDRILSLFK